MTKSPEMPRAGEALRGRSTPMPLHNVHAVLKTPLLPPYPEPLIRALFGMGCFWGAEKRFWQLPGVVSTAVGYSGGYTPHPTYQEVCSGQTGHNEVVQVVYDPTKIQYQALLREFWEQHDPTQSMRQGNDVGTQYRSGIYVTSDEQERVALASKASYQQALEAAGKGTIQTEILPATPFYFAEDYHQQYLAKNPTGYCGLGGIGVQYPD